LEKEQCVAEAEKFIAEFYRHKFIKPAPKNYQFNHIGLHQGMALIYCV
jgi:hypothetical protein